MKNLALEFSLLAQSETTLSESFLLLRLFAESVRRYPACSLGGVFGISGCLITITHYFIREP